jgi:exosortase A-associated hydrolase 2
VRDREAFMLPLPGGGRFCLFHPAASLSGAIGAAVYVHPFAEEMNKSRRMAAMQARALSASGISVLQIDLLGCGDSAGDFGDATWSRWVDDVVEAVRWVHDRTGFLPLLWGLRSGCLVACAALAKLPAIADLVFWQPVISGKQHLQQFLRLRVAGELIGRASAERTGTSELRAQLEEGVTLEIAGYALSPGLALGLDAANLAPRATPTRVSWLEVSASDPPEISPASQMRVTAWQAAGSEVAVTAVPGLAFWQTQEIAECAALIDATTAAVLRWRR